MIDIFWTNLSEGQGALLNGALTIVAAAVGVWIGARMFGARVANLQGAIDASKSAVDSHVRNMDAALNIMKEKTEAVTAVLAGMASQVGRIESNQVESGEANVPDEDQAANEPGRELAPVTKEKIFELWRQARDHMEELASDPSVDGRRRAKYLRIDRRSYGDFIDALEKGGVLPLSASRAAHDAHTMRNSFRRRNTPPTDDEIARMQSLVDTVHAVPLAEQALV